MRQKSTNKRTFCQIGTLLFRHPDHVRTKPVGCVWEESHVHVPIWQVELRDESDRPWWDGESQLNKDKSWEFCQRCWGLLEEILMSLEYFPTDCKTFSCLPPPSPSLSPPPSGPCFSLGLYDLPVSVSVTVCLSLSVSLSLSVCLSHSLSFSFSLFLLCPHRQDDKTDTG